MLLSIFVGTQIQAEGITLYVAPNGCDTWSGNIRSHNEKKSDGPLASVAGARDALRRMRQNDTLPNGPVKVVLLAGRYEQSEPVIFTEQDSGTEAYPILYTAEPGKSVRITGGVVLWQSEAVKDPQIRERLPQVARDKVRVVSLPKQNLYNYGVEPVGSSASPSAGLQLVYKDELLTLARWPNKGFVRVQDIPEGPKGNTFTYAEENPSLWAVENDPRGQGYWAHDWAACAISFASIDVATKTIRQRVPGSNYGFRKGGYWFGYNLLCELDQPGEYYLDRLSGKIYFWPPDDAAQGRAEVTVAQQLIYLDKVSNIQFNGLIFENCRDQAIHIEQGENVTIAKCTLRNIGSHAVIVSKGKNHRIAGCEMTHLGDGGIKSYGGDVNQLIHCGHVYDNNHIHDYARFSMTYGAAIQISGCGHSVTHNLIHNGPHVAILFGGRENSMSFNEIHSVCLTSGEMGAFYTGRDWTLVGNVIHGNYIHDIYNPRAQRNRAIMLDDGAAGIIMTQNLIVRVAEGISLSAVGNVIENNVFVSCYPAISGWQTYETPASVTPPKGVHEQMPRVLFETPVEDSVWQQRYPWLLAFRNSIRDKTLRPPETRTRVEHNVIWGGAETWMVNYKSYPRTEHSWLVENNVSDIDPLFVNASKDDYRFKTESPVLQKGVNPLPIEKMGLYASPERTVWPVKHDVNLVCTNLVYIKP